MKAKKERETGLTIVFSVIAVVGMATILIIVFGTAYSAKQEDEIAAFTYPTPPERIVTNVTNEPSPEVRVSVPQEDVEALKSEIASLRGEVTTLKEQIETLKAEIRTRDNVLGMLRAEKTSSLVDEFLKRPDTLKLGESTRSWLVSQLIPRLGELPNEWETRELALSIESIFPEISEVSSAWTTEIGKPDSNPSVAADLLAKKKALVTKWNAELIRILGGERGKRCRYFDRVLAEDVVGGR